MKNILIGNGINTYDYIPKKDVKKSKKLKLLTIANLAPWHGIDKVLIALSNVKYEFEYNIIGSGDQLTYLKQIVLDLKLENKVFFKGFMNKEKYLNYLHKSTLGIGSLAWSRVGLQISSTLKNREYI